MAITDGQALKVLIVCSLALTYAPLPLVAVIILPALHTMLDILVDIMYQMYAVVVVVDLNAR